MNDPYLTQALQSEFYRNKLAGLSITKWGEIPFTTKKELRQANPFELIGTERTNLASYHETSGTTGNPTSSWYSHRDIQREAERVVHSDLQLNDQDLVLNRYTFTLAVASFIFCWASEYARSGHISLAKSPISTYSRVLDTMVRTKPTILADIPFELEILASVAKHLGMSEPFSNLRALLAAGELLPPARIKWLKKVYGVPVYSLFGSTETGGLFMSCSHGNFHLDNPHVKLEVVDEEGQPLGFGKRGNCVISTSREGMPVLRYWNEDMVEVREASCGCGRKEPVLIHYGRASDCLQVENRTITMYELSEAVYQLTYVPMLWRFHQKENALSFEYQVLQVSDEVNMNSKIKEELEAMLGIRIDVFRGTIMPEENLLKESAVTKYKYLTVS